MSDRLREELLSRNENLLQISNVQDHQTLPAEVHVYHSLCLLETNSTSSVFGYVSSCYKAMNALDGKFYLLRRMQDVRLGNEASIQAIDVWRKLKHASLVSVKEAFTTKAFGDHCTFYFFLKNFL